MRGVIDALVAFLRASLATMVQYRGEMVLWAIWGVVYPAVAMSMWSAAVKGSGSDHIHGLGIRDFAAYFLLTMVVGHLSAAWDVFEMGYQVRTGAMSPKLLQPVLPIWQNVADNIAYKLVTLVLLIPIWIVVALVVHPHLTATPGQFVLGILAAIIGAALHFIWNYNIALGAFWMTRTEALAELWWGCNLLFGGRIAPLTIMPLPLQWIANVLPFQWIIWFPAAVLAGQVQTAQIFKGLAWQLFWLGLAIGFFRVFWRFSLRRYSAVGA